MGLNRHGGRSTPRLSLESVAPDVLAEIAAAESRALRRGGAAAAWRITARGVVLPLIPVALVAALVVSFLVAASPPRAAVARASAAAISTGAPGHPLGGAAGAAADPNVPARPETLTGYIWPLPQGRVTLPFGPTGWGTLLVQGELFHDGVDMATFCGDRVVAAHDGTVLAAGRHFDDFMGWVGDLSRYYARLDEKKAWNDLPITVVIDDGNGYRSMYAHFFETTVEPGQKVKAGDLIGYEGDTGHATGCHLHYGLFSPAEGGVFSLDPAIADIMQLPLLETARINPLLVLPWRWDVEEMEPIRTPPPGATRPPTPSPSPSPASSASR